MSFKSLFFIVLLTCITAFIAIQSFNTYPFEDDRRPSSVLDRHFFDPDKDHFYDLETN